MIRVLLLFSQLSIDNGAAKPDELKQLLEAATSELQVDIATYDDLVFVMGTGQASVTIPRLNCDITAYDVVYLRQMEGSSNEAMAVGKYCVAKGIPVADEEIALRPLSRTKLTQYMEFALQGIRMPQTIYATNGDLLVSAAAEREDALRFPMIFKAIDGSRGQNNYLVESLADARELVRKEAGVRFLVQQYIPNTSDYRVWVCEDQLGPILLRTRKSGHKNNTSQGGSATLLEDSNQLPQEALATCVRAAKIMHRNVAGVDIIFENDDLHGAYYILEVNRAPQIEGTPFEDLKARALAEYFLRKAKGKVL